MEKIATGLIRTTHGIHGYLKVKLFSGDLENFLTHTQLLLRKDSQERMYQVEDTRIQGDTVLVKLVGIDTPEAGKRLNGWELWIPREEASPLEEGEYYSADLHGCAVQFEGSTVGRVISLVEGPQADLLEIEKESGERRYVPFMDEYIGAVDIENRTIELRHAWIFE